MLQPSGPTAAVQAAQNHDVMAAGTLLSQPGADLNARDRHGNTVLHWTAWHLAANSSHRALFKQLVKWPGVDVQARNRLGETPAHWAAKAGCIEALHELSALDRSVLSARDEEGITPFLMCAQNDLVDTMEWLYLYGGVSIEEQDNVGRTALHWACYHARTKAVTYLLSRAASVGHRDHEGMTAVHWAVAKDASVEGRTTMDWLMRVGGSLLVDAPNLLGETPVATAWRKSNLSLVLYFGRVRWMQRLFGQPSIFQTDYALLAAALLCANGGLFACALFPRLWAFADEVLADQEEETTSLLSSSLQQLLLTWILVFAAAVASWINCKFADAGCQAPNTVLSML